MLRFILLFYLLCIYPATGFSQAMIADIDRRYVDINSSFAGVKLLLFGTREEYGNIIIVVSGPKRDFIVRKKEKIMGMWFNSGVVEFVNVPYLYKTFSSIDLDNNKNFLIDNEIIDNYLLEPAQDQKQELSSYKYALFEFLYNNHLYNNKEQKVSFIGNTLFRSNVFLPEKLLEGTYRVNFYLIEDNRIRLLQTVPMIVRQVGFNARIYNMANTQPYVYGLIAVLLSLSLGWLAKLIFYRK